MNKSSVLKGLLALLILFVLVLSAVSCKPNNGDNKIDKIALNAELALEVTEQGDYTTDSYNAYKEKLAEAKTVANDENATQFAVDKATSELSKARKALELRPIEAVKDADKEFEIISGDSKEIVIADYINVNGLSKISYKLMTSNEILTLSSINNGKFTISAGEVSGEAVVKVAINVYYDNVAKLALELTVTITNDVAPTLISEEFVKEYDLVRLTNKESIIINFAENLNNVSNLELAYSVKQDGEELVLDGSNYTFVFESYTEAVVYKTFTVTVSYTLNGEAGTLEYTYKLGVRDTGRYSIPNSDFENGLDGWTLTNTVGEAPFGGIDSKTHYWVQEFPMNNVGSYFSAYADGASEASHGNLASPYFIVNSEYATYMLGGAGNPNVFITIENKDGEVLGLYRNTMFADLPADVTDFDAQRELVGKSVFLANFVTYKVSLADFAGQEVRFVIHDYASEGWGVVFFDELNTYYTSDDVIPEGAVLAENLIANKAALKAELALEITAQGDYTADSYNAYLEKLTVAKAVLNNLTAAQTEVDEATAALIEARLALAIRPIEEVDGANKSFGLITGMSKEIALADYINANNLIKISYEIKASNEAVILSPVADGRFTITAANVNEVTAVKVLITAYYDGKEKLTVELSVQVTNDVSPSVFDEEVVEKFDILTINNNNGIIVDLSRNVDNPGNLDLVYYVDGIKLYGTIFTFNVGSGYTEEATYEKHTVTISYVANGKEHSISYTYKLGLYDSTVYRLENGGFENGLDGWTLVGNIGGVSSDTRYWINDPEVAEGFEFGMDGEKMFSAYAYPELEKNVGTLTSSTFKVGGSGFVTFKVGAMKDGNYVYVDVVDANTKQILARYYNGLWADRTNDMKSGCTLIAYKADLSAFAGREVFFRISDNADSGYGLFFADSFVTYYENEPEGFNDATPVGYEVSGTIYDLFNGGFEMGDVQGWWNISEIGVVTNANGYWGDNISYGKDGEYLFTGVESFGADTMRENNRGTLTSSAFEIGGTGMISFKLGGGGNELCYVQIIDVATNEVLARYHQQAQQDAVLIQYVADLSAHIGKTVRIQVVDYASSGWGCVSFDNVVTHYATTDALPEGIVANNIFQGVYNVTNGSFENGLEGWNMNITEAGTHNTLGWVESSEINADWYIKNDDRKDGNNIFTFCKPDDTNCENSRGTLNSSVFTLKQGTFVSFRFGAGSRRDVHVQLVRADGTVIATFYNEAEGKQNTEMYAYYYQYNGETADCFFRVVDDANSGPYGCFVVDDFRANLEVAPEGFIPAIQ